MYVSLCVWCDLCIYLFEVLGYYVILYSLVFVILMLKASFLAYICVMGVAGVLDYSGVDVVVCVRGCGVVVYDIKFYDLYYVWFNVNYVFLFDFIDRACGTYVEIKRDARVG